MIGNGRWLRPNKSYTVGRSTKNDVVVTSKSVSRSHGVITVGPVERDAYKHPSHKTKITIQDKSPKGLEVNGRRYEGGSTFDLDITRNDSFKLTFANSAEVVEIKWQPVVITFITGEYGRAHEQIAQKLRGYLEPMDIKLLPALHHATTHFLNASNKGSSKTLHALVRLIPIVTMDFAKTLHENADGLESNFWLKFPKVSDYLPDFDQRFEVNEKRSECFQGLTFIFFEAEQRDLLISVITTGGGKCLHYDMTKDDYPTDTKRAVQNIIDFVEKKGDKVLLVRLPEAKNSTDLNNSRFERQVKASTALGMDLVKDKEISSAIIQCSFEGLWAKTKRKAAKRASSAKSAASRGSIESYFSRSSKKQECKDEDDDDDLLDFEPIPAKKRTVKEPSSSNLYDFEPIPSKNHSKTPTAKAHDPELDADLEKETKNNDNDEEGDIFNFEPIPSKRKLQEQVTENAKRLKADRPNPPPTERSPSPIPDLEEEIMGEQSEKEQPAEPAEPELSAQGEEGEEEEYIPRLRDLALVESTMPIHRSVAVPQVEQQAIYGGRPNFKRFRRKGNPVSNNNKKGAKIDLVEASQDSVRKAQEVQTMFSDYSPKKKRPKSNKASQLPVKKQKIESVALSSDEDNLFLAPPDSQYISSGDDEPEIVEPSSHTQTGTRESDTAAADDGDSDADNGDLYDFKFSRD